MGHGVCHSSPFESHGLAGAHCGLMMTVHAKLPMKMRKEAPSKKALTDEKSFQAWRLLAYSNTRRGWPSKPTMNRGKNVMLKKANMVQKWILAHFWFIIRPVSLGVQ